MIETHPMARRLLARAIEQGRISHSYLFIGPEGAGKRTLALDFAASLVCAGKTFPPCRQCGACRRAVSGAHPDVIMVEAEGKNIKIDAIRALGSRLRLHSFEGGYKVGLVLDADSMNDASANAFLKTLEEPPADTVLILTSSNMNRLLPTIISRCQVLRIPALSDRVIAELLEKERGLPADQAALVAVLAGGNARRALDMEVEFVIDFRRKLIKKLVGLDCRDRSGILDFAEDLAKAQQPEAVFDLLSWFYQDVLHVRLGRPGIRNQDLRDEIEAEAGRTRPGGILTKMDYLHRARLRARGNANPRLNWEILTMSLTGVEGAEISAS